MISYTNGLVNGLLSFSILTHTRLFYVKSCFKNAFSINEINKLPKFSMSLNNWIPYLSTFSTLKAQINSTFPSFGFDTGEYQQEVDSMWCFWISAARVVTWHFHPAVRWDLCKWRVRCFYWWSIITVKGMMNIRKYYHAKFSCEKPFFSFFWCLLKTFWRWSMDVYMFHGNYIR